MIRQPQLDALQRARTEEFVRAAVADLRATVPERVRGHGHAELAAAVVEEMERCRAAGIDGDRAVLRAIRERFRRPALA